MKKLLQMVVRSNFFDLFMIYIFILPQNNSFIKPCIKIGMKKSDGIFRESICYVSQKFHSLCLDLNRTLSGMIRVLHKNGKVHVEGGTENECLA